MPRLARLARDPFNLPGRIVNDAQTSCKPASRVLVSDPALVAAFGVAGRWDESARRVEYGADPSEPGAMLDMETALRILINELRRLERDRATTALLLRAILNGAIAEGLRLQAVKGSRQLHMSGGTAILFERDPVTGGYDINRYMIPVLNPLKFYTASGSALIDPSLFHTLPSVCAGEGPGEIVAWPAKTYRVDTLALIPKGEDPVPEWYLFLGRPTQARTVDEIPSVPTPAIPAEHAGECLPLYRIVTRQGDKGIWGVEQIANRVNGV